MVIIIIFQKISKEGELRRFKSLKMTILHRVLHRALYRVL